MKYYEKYADITDKSNGDQLANIPKLKQNIDEIKELEKERESEIMMSTQKYK